MINFSHQKQLIQPQHMFLIVLVTDLNELESAGMLLKVLKMWNI